jgi:tRNA G10  N-methylase Trm11
MGCSVVSNIKNSPWRGTYDAIVTDPPYSMRTSLLPDHASKKADKRDQSTVHQHQSTDPGPLVPSLPTHSLFSQHTDTATVLPSGTASHDSCSVLEDLISFASTHLVPDGRLVFWWPEGKYTCSYVHVLDT